MEGRMKISYVMTSFILTVCISAGGLFAGPAAAAEKETNGSTVSPRYIIIDDYKGVSLPGREWYYSRIGTDRGAMGEENGYTADIGGGSASMTVQSGWGGVWTSLKYNAVLNAELNPAQLLGPHVKNQYQPGVVGVEIDILSGSGTFKIELKDKNGSMVEEAAHQLSGGSETLTLTIPSEKRNVNIAKLNWVINGAGQAVVDEIRFVIESPDYTVMEAAFLFTYGHLSQCYDPDSGLVRDRARWPVQDFAAVQCIGTFALATAVAWDLGYVEETTARTIITKTKNTVLNIVRHEKGLLPHFLKNGDIVEDTEWSSVDTVITLIAEILACQAMGEDTSSLEAMLQNIDWNDLTCNGAHSIGMGYDDDGNKLTNTWDTFGSEALLAAIAYCAATGKTDVKLDNYSTAPTWDGSGFNDELAALFFPMNGLDIWGNNWSLYRQEAADKQLDYFSGHRYEADNLLGLSACEVPEPWTVEEAEVYAAWGVGGHNGEANDGTSLVGYPIIAPHYAAMISAEHPDAFENIFLYLLETQKIFTPLNNVESFGIDSSSGLHWNSLKGSWDLSLQVLGLGRALSGGNYIVYQALSENTFLNQGFSGIGSAAAPIISLSRSDLNIGSTGPFTTAAGDILIGNSGGSTLHWTVTSNQSWLQAVPASGTGDGTVTVSVDASGLTAGSYQGTLTFENPNASNSPQVVTVHLEVYESGSSGIPFGTFATPMEDSSVSSSIPVTGWALDDIGVGSVKIYREDSGNLVYIGDALFVEGARPDVEQEFPTYPLNYKAGWGYMMLTNFLPNGGNGTFTIHAIAEDMEGHRVTLGTRTIVVDNANAVKPFGAIDTPKQGGTASGGSSRNHGWVLTPVPNSIPTDGSTINVYVDGVNIGHPVYNVYREDIATLFPGYANSNGAHAYFDFDTTVYENGVHTIQWTAEDNAGNADGIGSRYFVIQNTHSGRGASPISGCTAHSVEAAAPVKMRVGYKQNRETKTVYPGKNGDMRIEIGELERVVVYLGLEDVIGYQVVGEQLRALPIGSTLDPGRGIFYWQVGAGFIGAYQLFFIENGPKGSMSKKTINVKIVPKFTKN